MPTLWVDGTNDLYPMASLQKSYKLTRGPRTLSMRIRMPHGQGAGERPDEISGFADEFLRGGKALTQILSQGRDRDEAWVKFNAVVPVRNAELNFTRDAGPWSQRKWEPMAATIQEGGATARLPQGTTVYFFNLTDDRGLIVSSEHVEIPKVPDLHDSQKR
jgi:hypothetical protein